MNPLRWNKAQKAENELIVSGYIHINTKDIGLFMSIPVAIIQVIFKFYYLSLLNWDWDVVKAEAIKPVPDTINTIKQNSGGYKSIIAQNVISSDLYKRCYYEILIEDGSQGNIDLFVGYVKYLEDKTDHVFQDYVGSVSNNQDQYSVYLYQGWRYYAVYSRGRQSEISIPEMRYREWAVGDKIGIEIDFEENKAKAYYNEKYVGIMSNDLPKIVVPAISLFYRNMIVSSPKLQLFEK